MTNRHVPFLAALLIAMPPAIAESQMVPEGSRIRIAASRLGDKPVLATVVEIGADTVVIRPADRPVSTVVPRSEITSLQMSEGTRRPILKYALRGFLIGAGTGAVIGAVTYDDDTGYWCMFACSRASNAALSGVLGGVVGMVAGGIVGATRQSEKWNTVIDPRRVSIAPGGEGGVRVGYTAAF